MNTPLARTFAAAERLPDIRMRRGLIKAGELALGAQAESAMERARDEIATMMREARLRADAMRAEAEQAIARERSESISRAEQAIWSATAERQTQQERELMQFRNTLEDQALDVVRKALSILAVALPAEETIRSNVRALLTKVAPAPGCTLRVAKADLPLLASMECEIPWPFQVNPELAPGDCVLVTERGEWSTSFSGRLQSLMVALADGLADNEVELGDPDGN